VDLKTKEDLLDLDVQLAVVESKMGTWITEIKNVIGSLSFVRHKIHNMVKDELNQQGD